VNGGTAPPGPVGDGPLAGVRVVELASELGAFAGKLLADMGADVILVEPPGGHPTRRFGPFADGMPEPDAGLWFWHYNTSKRGVVVDLEAEADVFVRLLDTADIVIEAEPPMRLASLGLDHTDLRPDRPHLVWVSITPFGRSGPSRDVPATDLTILAGGGPVWNCGYDDHGIPPVRGGGNQGLHTACIWAANGALVALLHRDAGGSGQHVDVSAHAAANVTTEAGTYEWLVARATVQRQTMRHASVHPTRWQRTTAADGVDVHPGFPPRRPDDFRVLISWLEELGLADEFPETAVLALGAERDDEIRLVDIGEDPLATEIFGAGREATRFIAAHLPAREFFVEAQRRGITAGIVQSPEEVVSDPHVLARGWPVALHHDGLGREVVHPGVPIRFTGSPATVRSRAPRLGEHDGEVLDGP
jgi:crotonobetainyl-CoA:carnitine CoA-transferase CaiB-like acyl-CoA transferase